MRKQLALSLPNVGWEESVADTLYDGYSKIVGILSTIIAVLAVFTTRFVMNPLNRGLNLADQYALTPLVAGFKRGSNALYTKTERPAALIDHVGAEVGLRAFVYADTLMLHTTTSAFPIGRLRKRVQELFGVLWAKITNLMPGQARSLPTTQDEQAAPVTSSHSTPPPSHPRGLYVLFFTEMWERFSFYLMIGLLLQFLTDKEMGGFGWKGAEGAKIVGLYSAMCYFTPFIGGLIADRVLGLRKTIAIGGFLMMVGHALCAIDSQPMFLSGLVFLVLGNGGFKPNISALVGNMYPIPPNATKEQREEIMALRDRAYSIFYVGINVGALICNIIAALVRNYFNRHPEYGIIGWHAAFGTAAIGMFIGLVNFLLNYRYLGQFENKAQAESNGIPVEKPESLRPLWTRCLGPAVVVGAIGYFLSWKFHLPLKPHNMAFLCACIPVGVFYINIWRQLKTSLERGRTAVLLVIITFSMVFWTVFQQNHTALNEHAISKTDRDVPGWFQPVVNTTPDFAENAPLSYFFNAGPNVPRPSPDHYIVVSDNEHTVLEKEGKLSLKVEGQPARLYVTKKQFDGIYRFDSPRLTGEHLLLNAELYQSINPGCVLLLTPLLLAFFLFLHKRQREPSTAAKIAIGIIIVSGGPLIMLACTIVTGDAAIKASSWWLIGSYTVATIGELCLSPMGTSLVHRLAPRQIRSFMLGGWFLSSAIGNKLSGVFGEVYYTMDHRTFYGLLAVFCIVAGTCLLCLLPWMKRLMAEEMTLLTALNPAKILEAVREMEKAADKKADEVSAAPIPATTH